MPDPALSLAGGAIAPWKGATPAAVRKCKSQLDAVPGEGRHPLEHAAGEADAQDSRAAAARRRQAVPRRADAAGKGVRHDRPAKPKRQRLEAFRGEVRLPECGGARLRPEARAVRIAGKAIHEITRADGRRGPGSSSPSSTFAERRAARSPSRSSREIASRLAFLDRVGLDYLTLDRPADTLSGGELQRVRLATGLGSGLVGVCYVLDEPSIGLHPRDNQRLIDALRDLQARGNTVVVVEHDETIMRQADWLIDLGPGRGPARRADRRPGHARRSRRRSRSRSPAATWRAASRSPCPQRRRRIAKTRSITHRRRDDQQPQERHACSSRSRRWCA